MVRKKPNGADCAYCGRFLVKPNITDDHIIPKKDGGSDSWSNIAWADIICNNLKSGMSVAEFEKFLNEVVYTFISKEDYQKLRLDKVSVRKFFRKFWNWYRSMQKKEGFCIGKSGYPQLVSRQLELPL